MHHHAPSTVSQHLQGLSSTVISSPQTIIGPGLWHVSRADGQEGHFSRSVKLEGPSEVVGRIAQLHWPLAPKHKGREGAGWAAEGASVPSMSGTRKELGGVSPERAPLPSVT